MSLTASHMLALGTIAPDFNLYDAISTKTLSLAELKGEKLTVIFFMCNHCPYVVHILPHLLETINKYQSKAIKFIAINANDLASYPQDGPEPMQALAKEKQFNFPYLFDASQEVAKAYQAACTPDFYIFDPNLACIYRGRYDASSPGKPAAVTGADLIGALDNWLKNHLIVSEQLPSMGCNIKWRV